MPTYNYLLGPNFQAEDESGKPLVGGYVEVYLHNTTTQYVTKKDFNGTNNEFRVVLNSLGMAVIIADVANAYDVYCYDRFGSLKWSRQNVNTIGGSGGGGGGGGGLSAPLVGVELKSSGATKRFGDDGFVKNNPSNNQPSLYLPELGWWLFNVRLFLRNETARDLVQHITLEWNWNSFIAEGVPPATYTALYPPSMQTDVDFTTTFTRQYGASTLIHKESNTDEWLTVRPVVYGGTPLTDTEWVVAIDIFKVRDA